MGNRKAIGLRGEQRKLRRLDLGQSLLFSTNLSLFSVWHPTFLQSQGSQFEDMGADCVCFKGVYIFLELPIFRSKANMGFP